jgi:hypothetical protein
VDEDTIRSFKVQGMVWLKKAAKIKPDLDPGFDHYNCGTVKNMLKRTFEQFLLQKDMI